MRAQQGQVVVLLVSGVGGLESGHQLHPVVSPWAQAFDHELAEALLLRGRHLGPAGWDPDRRGLPGSGDPGVGALERAVDDETPVRAMVVGLPARSGQRSAPKRGARPETGMGAATRLTHRLTTLAARPRPATLRSKRR